MTLWERADALALLDRIHRETASTGRVALLSGEAGIGKSATVSAFAQRHAARSLVLWGVCDPLVTPRASGPLHDIARQAGGLLAQRVDEGADRADTFGALIDELTGPRQRPRRIVVVEDIHWADEATHDLLVFLGRRIERLPAMLVVTYRDDEIEADHPLHATLAALPRAVVRRVPLALLSRQCVTEQAATAGHDADELYRLTGGNPLLLTEMLAAGDVAVPGTARDLILARLRSLSPAAQDVARLVAVMPTSADAVLLTDLATQVDECIAHGVLAANGDRVSYRHEMLRQAVEDSLSPARRSSLHRRALALLEAVDGTDPARLVHHARYAGDGAAVLRHGVVAAARAAALGAHREAAAQYRAVTPYGGRLSPGQRADLLERYANEAYLAGDSVHGLEARRAALAEREALDDPVRAGENLRWISRLAWWNGEGAQARAAAARAIEVLEAGTAGAAGTADTAGAAGSADTAGGAGTADTGSRELAMAYSNRSQLHMLAYELPEAIAWGERARDLADRLDDRPTSVHATINVLTARFHTDGTAAAALQEVYVAADRAGLPEQAIRALLCVMASYAQAGEAAAAAPLADEALEYVLTRDLDGYAQHISGVRAGIRLERCDWSGALADAEQALNRPSRIGIAVVDALVAKGRILAARGDPAALSTLDSAARHAYGTEELLRIGPVAAARSEYFLLAGDADRAADEARPALELAQSKGHRWIAGELAFRLWQATGTAGSSTWPEPYQRQMAGDWRGAAAAWAQRGREYSRILALAGGDGPAVGEAMQALTDLGADRVRHRLRTDLRQRGVTGVPRGPRRSTADNAAGLTTRQLEVLRLLADGLSNADIADRLTLSRKTVEHHISAVLDKLGVSTRGQAIAAAHRGLL